MFSKPVAIFGGDLNEYIYLDTCDIYMQNKLKKYFIQTAPKV